jgi:hypothetical protein
MNTFFAVIAFILYLLIDFVAKVNPNTNGSLLALSEMASFHFDILHPDVDYSS